MPGAWLALALAVVSFALFRMPPPDEASLHTRWHREASLQIAGTLAAVGNEVARLETVSATLAERVEARVATGTLDVPTAFALLDSLAQVAERSRSLTPGTAIGLQLFDARGERVAWAGWPQSVSPLDRLFIDSGVSLVYTREVSLYQILSHVAPCSTQAGERVATLLVDMPLEVDYRVNNRFLKSASLADVIPRDVASRVRFDYYPPTGNLPERMPRFREQQAEARERMAAMRARPAPEEAPRADADSLRTPSRRDSVLSYYAFPDNVEPAGEAVGNEATGLQGIVLIRSRGGNPLLNVGAASEPISHRVALSVQRRALWARVTALLGLLALFAQSMLWIGRREGPRRVAARALSFVLFMVALRVGLIAVSPVGRAPHNPLFDPSVFATPAMFGMLQSTFDLLLTAAFLVMTLYGLVRIVRGRNPEAVRVHIPAGPWKLAGPVLVAIVTFGVLEIARRFVSMVVVNANPRLLGDAMDLTDTSVLALHVGVFLMVTGLLLTGMFALWGAFRIAGETRPLRTCVAGWVLIVIASLLLRRAEPVMLSALVLLFVAFAPRIAHRENLVSVGIAAFWLVVVASGSAYLFLARDYDELRQSFVLEKSQEVTNPADNWKVVILEDVLGDYAQRPEIHQAIRSPETQDIDRLAFDLWAGSPLSLLGYSCAIHVVSSDDSLLSEFSVDMPYRVRIEEGGERTDTPDGEQWAVLDLTRSTPQGVVRFYRGVLNIDESDVFESGLGSQRLLGKVIVDVPFFFESLELAARTGPRTPEVLRNVQEGGVAPRIEEPEALLLARVDESFRVRESSSELLAVGTRVAPATMERAVAQSWPLLRAGARDYRVAAIRSEGSAETLLAGYAVPSAGRHLLRWSTLLSLYLFFTVVVLIAVVMLGAIPALSRTLPTLTPGRRLGFQQKLLASFLVVALAPAVILGLFSVDFIKNRFLQENRSEASYKAFSARKAFVNLLHGELQFFLKRSDLPQLFPPGAAPVRALGSGRVAMLFDDATTDDAATGVPVAGSVEGASTEDLVLTEVDGVRFIGVFSAPLKVSGEAGAVSCYVYYARAINTEVLGEVAEQVGADVNVYADGDLIASSREGLLAGGFISATMNADAYVEVSMLGSDRMLATERAGSYDFQVAYLPVDRWVPTVLPADSTAGATVTWGPASTRAAMGVPLLFRPESYSLEVQRATSVVLGVFALLLAATIALGLVVARGVFEPLRGLVAGTRRVSRGDFDVRLPERRSDEIGIVVSAFNEMTEKIAESQRALEERRRYLEAILENIGAGVVSTDAEGRVRTLNAAAERIIAAPAQEFTGKLASELAHGEHAPQVFALLAESAQAAFASGELAFRADRPATVKYLRTRLEAEGRVFGTVLVFEDVTELIESKKLSAWVEMARQIAHEIKNPLTPIRLSTQFMRRAYEQKPAEFERVFHEGTETILHQVDVLKKIASEFSSYGRMQQLDVKPHAVDPLVRHIVTPYQQNAAAVRIVYENGAAGAEVLADAEAVRKICANLIENAMEAMGPAGGELRVRCSENGEDDARVIRIAFRDNGPGLKEEVTGRLFEPYFSTKTTGTGLGLAICRTLSREMGGDVTVENAAQGTGVEAVLTLRRA